MTTGRSQTPSVQREFLGIVEHLRLAWRLWRDRRVPLWPKLVPLAALVYVLVPFDLLADPILGLGQIDDLGVIVLGLKLFVALCPAALVAQHRQRLNGDVTAPAAAEENVVEATYRVLDDNH